MSALSRGNDRSSNNQTAVGNRTLLQLLITSVFLLAFQVHHSLAFSVPADGVSKIDRTIAKAPSSPEDIESFVKALEYEARDAKDQSPNDLIKIDLNLLNEDTIGYELQDGLQEEFQGVDAALQEASASSVTEKPGPTSRQLSLIYQGVYAPDSRFNAFADGVMVNMVAEMKRKRMDPLYFRVYDRGIVEHVTTRTGREGGRRDEPPAVSSSSFNGDIAATSRGGRQRGNAIGGGVIRGLTNTKRFGNAEVQIAGNTTLVRSHYVFGPLNIELLYNTEKGVKSVNSTLGALASHAVAGLKDHGSKLIDFIIDSPSDYEVQLVGARSRKFQRISQSAINRLFKPTGTLERRLKQQFIRSRSRRIPDVTNRANRNSHRNVKQPQKNDTTTISSSSVPDPELP